MQKFPVNPNCALAFQKSNDERDRILRRNLQAHVDVVRHRVPFQNLHSFLLTEVPQNATYRSPELAINHLSAILWDENYVVLALPTNMRQRFKVFHALYLLWPSGAFRR